METTYPRGTLTVVFSKFTLFQLQYSLLFTSIDELIYAGSHACPGTEQISSNKTWMLEKIKLSCICSHSENELRGVSLHSQYDPAHENSAKEYPQSAAGAGGCLTRSSC